MLKARNSLAIGFAISLASQFAADAADFGKPADPHHRRYVHHRIPAVRGSVATTAVAPGVTAVAKPAASLPVRNDSDGLSRDPEDCNKGCLDSSE
jgi:hypothetical protein